MKTVSTLLDERPNDLSDEPIEKFSFLSVHFWGEEIKLDKEWEISITGSIR